jgi:formylglycine-generating enzyme required for sulfatase activity
MLESCRFLTTTVLAVVLGVFSVNVAADDLKVIKDCKQCPEMVVVPAGKFVMGSPKSEAGHLSSEGPLHEVIIPRPFAVGRHEVTFKDWEICVQEGECTALDDSGFGRARRPVINVTFEQVLRYTGWLSRKTGQNYRLLSEAEWEYAARAGTDSPRFWEGPEEVACHYANVYDVSAKAKRKLGIANFACNDKHPATAPAGSYKPNAFGLYDMLGNVWEWVGDCYMPAYDGAPIDGRAWVTSNCTDRVFRGGGWSNDPSFVRSAVRNSDVPPGYFNDVGFRLAKTIQ